MVEVGAKLKFELNKDTRHHDYNLTYETNVGTERALLSFLTRREGEEPNS